MLTPNIQSQSNPIAIKIEKQKKNTFESQLHYKCEIITQVQTNFNSFNCSEIAKDKNTNTKLQINCQRQQQRQQADRS